MSAEPITIVGSPVARNAAGHAGSNGSVLLIGNYRPTITLSRELRANDYRVIVGVTDIAERGYEYSNSVSEWWVHTNHETDPALFFDELNRFLGERDDLVAVIPVAEDMLTLLSGQRARLNKAEIFAMAEHDQITQCVDKAKSLQLVAGTGIDQAPFEITDCIADLQHASQTIGFPLIIRPISTTNQFGAEKAVICRNETELKTKMPTWPDGHDEVIVQALFNGPRRNIYFAAENGVIKLASECLVERTDRIDGTGVQITGVTTQITPKLLEDTASLVSKLNYSGVGCAQFLEEPKTKTTCFIELNPRIAGSHAVPVGAGINLGCALVDLVKGNSLGALKHGAPGLRFVWTYGDLAGLARELRGGRLSPGSALKWAAKLISLAIRADEHVTWSLRDPKPAFMIVGLRVLRTIKKGLNRIVKTKPIASSSRLESS